MSESYVHIRKKHGGLETSGTTSFHLGHELPPSKLNKPEGIFAAWSWDGSCLRVRNDRYGFYPLYYFVRDAEIALSTSIPKLLELGAPVELDETALAVFLRLGFFISEDTPFRYIRAVPPDTKFEWKDGILEVEGTLSLGKHASWTRKTAVEAFISLARLAVRRRIPSHGACAVPLSGGRDTRHILLELCESGYRPDFCVTLRHFPPRNNSDAECALQVAAALGVKCVVVSQPKSQFQADLAKNLKTSFCSDEHTHFMALADFLRGKVDTTYDGTGAADVFSFGPWLKPEVIELFRSNHFNELAARLLGHDSVISRMLPREQYRKVGLEVAITHLSRELKRYTDTPSPVASFYFWSRTRREIALSPYSVLDTVPIVFAPFLDHEFYDCQASLPPEVVVDRRFHNEVLEKAFPRFAGIPYETKTPEVNDVGHFRRYASELTQFYLRRFPSRFVRGAYLLPRLLRCLCDRSYASSISWLAPLAGYLLQLEAVVEASHNRLTQNSRS